MKLPFLTITILLSFSQALAIPNTSVQSQITTSQFFEDEEIIFSDDLQPAEFPGGINALMQFISENIIYPQECADRNIQGKIYCTFCY